MNTAPQVAMATLPGRTALLHATSDAPYNLTGAVEWTGVGGEGGAGGGGGVDSMTPLCTLCCCGLLNHTLVMLFMVTLAFAIVVGNVVTLTVFMLTRQSRTPQGYLKGRQLGTRQGYLKGSGRRAEEQDPIWCLGEMADRQISSRYLMII